MAFIFALGVWACSQSLYVPSVDTAADASKINELTEGRTLYIKQCGSCHNLFKPQTFTKEKWASEMIEMKKEAKITDQQAALILQYVTGFRS